MGKHPEIVRRGAFIVAGLKVRGTQNAILRDAPPTWGHLMARADEIERMVNRRQAFGVIGKCDSATGELDYLAGFEVADATSLPAGMASWRLPAQTYAVFPCTLPTLMDTFREIYDVWLPRSGRERGDGPEFELYGEEFDPQDANSRMYIYVPVK
jgi:AraC family transcriptional regulator